MLGSVTITKRIEVSAGEKVGIDIKYTATQTIADTDTTGKITITLPAGWGPSTDDAALHELLGTLVTGGGATAFSHRQ